jgi:hypothetical protein
MHLAVTDYGNFLQNEPSPLQTLTISERCTEKLVEEFNYLRCNASAELAKFLDYITCVLLPISNSQNKAFIFRRMFCSRVHETLNALEFHLNYQTKFIRAFFRNFSNFLLIFWYVTSEQVWIHD